MYDLGYLQHLDHAGIPTSRRTWCQPQQPEFDPGRNFSIPWQSGMTGYRPHEAAPDIHSVNDLFDPKYKGKVEMLTEMRDTVPLVMKATGSTRRTPPRRTGWTRSTSSSQAADSGQIRRFTGNDYTRDLTSGDVAAIIGWSGDGSSSGRQPGHQVPDAHRRLHRSSDNMVIPVGAPNPAAAGVDELRLRPEEPGPDRGLRQYVTPVNGVRTISEDRPGAGERPADLPDRAVHQACAAEPTPAAPRSRRSPGRSRPSSTASAARCAGGGDD